MTDTGVFFNLDISPMLVIYQETRPSFTSFLTGVCAIVGGIFTVAGIVDSVVYRAERQLRKKMELGKAL
jgi:endoplasmic reticulum-Golgi intermediate compartment protein 3